MTAYFFPYSHLTDTARLMLLGQPTPSLFTCSDPHCVWATNTWEDDLPAEPYELYRKRWPKCPDKHKARFLCPQETL